jgi:hypothetical protein
MFTIEISFFYLATNNEKPSNSSVRLTLLFVRPETKCSSPEHYQQHSFVIVCA